MTLAPNFGQALTALARAVPDDRPALIHGDRTVTWGEFDRRTDSIAAGLLALGLSPGDVVGQQLRNGPDYLLAWFGCAKAGLIPVNINHQYGAAELADIYIRFGVKAVVLDADFAPAAGEAKAGAPELRHLILPGSSEWDALVGHPMPDDFTLADDPHALFYIATGGTTGMPKAVMWPHSAAWEAFGVSQWPRGPGEPPHVATTLGEHAAEAARHAPPSAITRSPTLMLSPLMHGAGLFAGLIVILHGGTLATVEGASFDADRAIDAVRDTGAVGITFVGDAFALPLADALERRADGADAVANLRFAVSSGAVFSPAVKQRLLAVQPQLVIVDALGSSESAGTAVSVTTVRGESAAGGFTSVPGRETRLFDDDLNEVPAGSGRYGVLARAGPLPLGYLGEDAVNARTFPVIDGRRWLMTGDLARMDADGRLEFLGRSNMCINTGGEKVSPEEVEAVLLDHPDVTDALVVSVPDERFGRRVAAVVRAPGSDELEGALNSLCRDRLARYKVPRLYVWTEDGLRLNNGKPDYRTAQRLADAAH